MAVVLVVTADAVLLSLVGETTHLWLAGRESALVDLVANTLGGALGAVLSVQWTVVRGQ